MRIFASALAWEAYRNDPTYTQLVSLCRDDSSSRPVVLFPDLTPDAGLPTGALFASEGRYYPLAVGSDLGCGYTYALLDRRDIDLDLARTVLARLPERAHRWAGGPTLIEQLCAGEPPELARIHSDWQGHHAAEAPLPVSLQRYLSQLGLANLGYLSPGNHFLEVHRVRAVTPGTPLDGALMLFIHNGSGPIGATLVEVLRRLWQGRGEAPGVLAPLPVGHRLDEFFWAARDVAVHYARLHRQLLLRWASEMLRSDFTLLGDNTHSNLVRQGQEIIHLNGVTQVADTGSLIPIAGTPAGLSYLVRVCRPEITLGGLAHGTGYDYYSAEGAPGDVGAGVRTNLDPERLRAAQRHHRRIDIAYELLRAQGVVTLEALLEPVVVLRQEGVAAR